MYICLVRSIFGKCQANISWMYVISKAFRLHTCTGKPDICCFRGFYILTDGLKTTEEFAIQNHQRLACNLVLKVIEKTEKSYKSGQI